ncbi:MAG TPA: patatin-like phospholipase family protein [Thermoleophilaceae bacterium]|nr:patatin-like phospholipase family protein [Thermoleophilaceae bacterium]
MAGSGVDLAKAAREAPRGKEASQLPECDLVMKGGITSGVVYPGAVLALLQEYRLNKVGGSSAGAIAAGLSAAAEFGRQHGTGAGLVELEKETRTLATQQGFLLHLFQPTADTRQAFDLAMTGTLAQGSGLKKADAVISAGLWQRPWLAALGTLVSALVIAVVVAAFGPLPVLLALAVAALGAVAVTLIVLAVFLAAVALPAKAAVAALAQSGFGFCPGRKQPGYSEDGLTEWLDRTIQRCAGLPLESERDVLTFGRLHEACIDVEMTTTDLSAGRPVLVPEGLSGYRFQPRAWRRLFPDHVLSRLIRAARELPEDAEIDLDDTNSYACPTADLPVVVGVRLSLSFPGLMSAIPITHVDDEEPNKRLFSDGGISSNFPIHFFDLWFPSHPTFGLDLVDFPPGDTRPVAMSSDSSARRWHPAGTNPLSFGLQIKDAMQNWRDTMQTDLPGFRDRVCQIRMKPAEGGLNLQMKLDTIDGLMERGYAAGQELLKAFPAGPVGLAKWRAHCLARFLLLMRKQQDGLVDVRTNSVDFQAWLATGPPEYADARTAYSALSELLQWPPEQIDIDFDQGPPDPDPSVMRIVPRA